MGDCALLVVFLVNHPSTTHSLREYGFLILALVGPPIAIGALLWFVLLSTSPSNTGPEDMWVGADEYGPASAAAPSDIRIVHEALHEIGTHCRASSPDLSVIAADVDLIIAFSQRYPLGRFPIDDESATASSLLVVTREAIKDCASANLGRIDTQLRNLRVAEDDP